MVALLELKDKLKNIYAENENILKPIFKFIAVFVSMILVKYNIGYLDTLNMWIVILGISVLFAFLPWNIVVIGMGAIITVNICSLSLELGALVLIVCIITILFFFRFTPKEGIYLVLIPLAFFLKVPYAIPLAVGLICTPISIVSVSCGTIVYFIIHVISQSAGATGETSVSLSEALTMIANNKEMILTIVAFAVTVTVVYLIRKASINNAWTVAILVGGIADFVVLLVGNLILGTDSSILWLIIGTILSLVIVYIIQFFIFSVDYSRVEHTQFEDDEYYYYVKAVPKINVAAPEMNVKRINAQRKRKATPKTRGNSN